MSASSPNQSTLRVVQLNAENLFLFLDQDSTRDWRRLSEKEWQNLSVATTPNKALSKTLWLADSLLDIDADIVCLNEIGGEESLRNFARHFLGDQYVPYLLEGNSDRGIDVGYLVKRTLPGRVELRTHKDRPLGFLYPHERSEPEGAVIVSDNATPARSHYFSRDCAELRVYGPTDNERPAAIFLSVHLKSKLDPDGIDPEGKMRRQAELRTLMEIYRERHQEFSPPVPILIAGDFNARAREPNLAEELADIRDSGLKSVTELAELSALDATTQIQFLKAGGQLNLEIDFIFVSPEMAPFLIRESVRVYRYKSDLRVELPLPTTLDQRLQMPSDHYPVVASFNWFF